MDGHLRDQRSVGQPDGPAHVDVAADSLRSNHRLSIGTPGQVQARIEEAIPRVRAEVIGGDERREENFPAADRGTHHSPFPCSGERREPSILSMTGLTSCCTSSRSGAGIALRISGGQAPEEFQ